MEHYTEDALRSGLYAKTLYELAERVKARSVVEAGLGWGISSREFLKSMANRKPATLTTVEVIRSTTPRQADMDVAKLASVAWNVIYEDAQRVAPVPACDLLYIDVAGSAEGHFNIWRNLGPALRSGGLLVLDGLGERAESQGAPGSDEAFARMAAECGGKPEVIPYLEGCAFGVVKKR